MHGIWQEILGGAANSSWLELTAAGFGLLSVWLATRQSIALYPTGLVSVGLYVYICGHYKLYADMAINAYYFVISVYGWVLWAEKKDARPALPITTSSRRAIVLYGGVVLVGVGVIGAALRLFTDSDVPLWDAATTSLFAVAMVLMARKKIEHWMVWIIGNTMSVPLYVHKGLAFTAFQYVVFTVLAGQGLRRWQKALRDA